MNAILSFIVCIAMLCSPTGALPAQPETASTWTVRNITLDVGDESVTLAPEARLTTAVGTEEAVLHFEIGSGESTLLPMTGAIDAEGVRFSFGTGVRTYTLSNETFLELTGMTEEDAVMLDAVTGLFVDYAALLNTLKDEEKLAQYGTASLELLEAMMGAEFAQTEADVEGEMVPAVQLSGEVTGAGVLNMLDVAAECGIPEMETFVDSALELINLTSGMEPVEKFADLAAAAGEEMDGAGVELDMLITTQEPAYARTEMTLASDGMEMTYGSEFTTRGDETKAVMVMGLDGGEEMSMVYNVDLAFTGPLTAPTAVYGTYNVSSRSSYSYDSGVEGEEPYQSVSGMDMFMTIDASSVDGLESALVEMIVETEENYGYGDDLATYSDTVVMGLDYLERLEEDGSVTGVCSLATDNSVMPFSVSFELNRAEGEVVDYFAGKTEQALTADPEDAGYNLLSADVMALAADATRLTADESVMALVEMFTGISEYEYDDYEEYEEYDGYEYTEEYEEATYVSTFEEAAAIYDGYIPDFTAPEGYALDSIVVDGYSLVATYASGDNYFDFTTYSYWYADDTVYYTMKDGVLSPIADSVVEMGMYEDTVISASVYAPEGIVSFYFSDADLAEAEAVLAGLN